MFQVSKFKTNTKGSAVAILNSSWMGKSKLAGVLE
jgi:hypothetical protein